MKSEDFVRAVQAFAIDSAAASLESQLAKPSGREPSQKLMELSAWFNKLNEQDRKHLHAVIQMAARGSAFGILCILDGVRGVVKREDQSSFELYFVTENGRVLLNDSKDVMLHDMLGEE
jgi:hypothetical protein